MRKRTKGLLKHNTYAVYAFQRKLIEFVKSNYPQVEHIVYFSDGCAGQYKNRFNVSNLVNHFEDFGLTAEWHFFATSRGKGPSDGLGGALKRAAARASLRKVGFQKITTPKELFCFCKENLPGMNIEFVLIEEIQKSIDFLEDRFKRAAKVTNIMKIHKIVPVDKTTIEVARESSWSQSYIIKLKEEKQKGPSGKGSGGEGSLQPAHQSSVSTVTKRKSSSHEPNPKRKK